MRMTENNEIKKKKLLVLGLENSGKTSILISLRKDTNLMSYCGMKPTKGIKIEELAGVSAWDFGGQEKYREEYLINFNKYSEKADKVIYVIDVQDLEKYDNALKYLEKIVNLLIKYKKFIDFSIFFHKYDPNLTKIKQFENIDATIDSKLITAIGKIIPPEIKYNIYYTTIYTLFEKTSVHIK